MTAAADNEETVHPWAAGTIAPLRDGDVETVRAVVEGLSVRSRRRRFGKLELQPSDLALHARVGGGRHVLVAHAAGRPVAVAHLVRDGDSSSAEAAVVVADEWQRAGIGRALARRLAADAAAAGITRVHALVAADNQASLALMRGATAIVGSEFEGADVRLVGELRVRLPGASPRQVAGSPPTRRLDRDARHCRRRRPDAHQRRRPRRAGRPVVSRRVIRTQIGVDRPGLLISLTMTAVVE